MSSQWNEFKDWDGLKNWPLKEEVRTLLSEFSDRPLKEKAYLFYQDYTKEELINLLKYNKSHIMFNKQELEDSIEERNKILERLNKLNT